MALSDACSPSNITAAPREEEVLTKMEVEGVVIRNVDAKPEPPWLDILEVESSDKVLTIAGSMVDGIVVYTVGA